MALTFQPPPLHVLQSDFLEKHEVTVTVKRLDLIHPFIQGNKWYKLNYNIEQARKEGKNTLLTFGGAYSNHIYATAAAGKALGFKTIGIIRGEKMQPLNPILAFATTQGMELHFISRTHYKQLRENFSYHLLAEYLQLSEQTSYIIPEGGSNYFAVKGCQEISQDIENQFDTICCACGTGSTLAGIINGCPFSTVQKIGFAVLKGGEFLVKDIQKHTASDAIFSIQTTYHAGGYAKTTKELLLFIENFMTTYRIPIEPTYTGKLFWGLFDLISKGYFEKGSRILAIHTGGIYQH